jgi:SAM-dependent methyltransferase
VSSPLDTAYDRLREQGHSGWGASKFRERMEGWQRELATWLATPRFPKTGRVLELGCGNGAVSALFASAGYQVTGVDYSESAVRWARQSFEERNLVGEFHCADIALGLPQLEDRQFSVVLDGNCLHCVLGDARAPALAAIRRVVRDDGTFIVSSMCGEPRSPEARTAFDPSSRYLREDGRACRYLPPRDVLIEEIRVAGFRPISWRLQENDWWDHLWMIAEPT